MRSAGRRRGGRWGRGRRAYLGKLAHPPHPACCPGEEGRSLSQPGVVSSPLGESPSPPNWLLREWRALSGCRRSARRGSALFHRLGTRKLRGQFFPSPEKLAADCSSFPGVSSASEREDASALLVLDRMEAAYRTGIAPFSASKVLNCCERAWRGGGAPGRSLRLPPSVRIAPATSGGLSPGQDGGFPRL